MPALQLVKVVVAAFALVVPAAAQVTASLVANTPMTVGWNVGPPIGSGSNSHPAGALNTDGSLVVTAPPGFGQSRLEWRVPQTGSASCSLRASHTHASSTVHMSAADLSMSVTGPIGQHGQVRISLFVWDDAVVPTGASVDVGDDGAIEATAANFYWLYEREWLVPVVLGPTGLDIRIRHSVGSSLGPGADWRIDVAFEPTANCATDFGSSCTSNDVGWLFPDSSVVADNHPYFLHAAPAPGPNLCRLVARGHGPFTAFLVAMDPTRVAPGWLGIGNGCDDLLQNVAFTLPGKEIAAETWEFGVPALPPGITFYVQHASFGLGSISTWQPPTPRTGVTNLVQVQS